LATLIDADQLLPVNAVLTGAGGSIDLTMLSLLPENVKAEPAFSSQGRNRIVLYGGPGNWYQPVQTGNVLTVQDILAGVFSLYYQKLEDTDRSTMPHGALDDALFYARARNASDPRTPSYCLRRDTLQNRTRFSGIQWCQARQSWEILMK
jgi:hypothetical protein